LRLTLISIRFFGSSFTLSGIHQLNPPVSI